MISLRLDDLAQHSDTLHARSGEAVTVRFVAPGDSEELQNYYRSLSAGSRYNRFHGAMSELPPSVLDQFIHVGRDGALTVIATIEVDGFETIVGEARYALHTPTRATEFGLSIADRWHGRGIGTALMKNLECRVASLGATSLFGDTLRSNSAMIALARKSGFAFGNHPDDWKLVRFEKQIDVAPKDIPCASWQLSAQARQLAA